MASAAESEKERPYYLAKASTGSMAETVESVQNALKTNGFSIAGEYSPYPDAHIIAITDDELRSLASKSDFGGYGSALRVAITKVNDQTQVSYTNPVWINNIYRMDGDMSSINDRLKNALGQEMAFGSKKGKTIKHLRKYHYMMFMPYFKDHIEIAKFSNHQEAIKAVESGLAEGKGGTAKVYSVDVSGKDETLFGVALKEGTAADQAVMAIIDKSEQRHTAHLPYDLLVSDGTVYMLHGKFRIAQSFPDLSMGKFMKISKVPDGIETTMKAIVSD